jgi:hypothetical protein
MENILMITVTLSGVLATVCIVMGIGSLIASFKHVTRNGDYYRIASCEIVSVLWFILATLILK